MKDFFYINDSEVGLASDAWNCDFFFDVEAGNTIDFQAKADIFDGGELRMQLVKDKTETVAESTANSWSIE